MRTILGLSLLLVPAVAGADPTVTAGFGGGAFSYRVAADDDPGQVSFRELGADGETQLRGLTLGLQASVRLDTVTAQEQAHLFTPIGLVSVGGTPGSGETAGDTAVPLVAATRWRLAPYVAGSLEDFHWKLGVVAGNYYDPTQPASNVWVFPMVSLGLGNKWASLDIGLLDSPAVASSADGGLGVLAMRVAFALAPRHHIKLGIGSTYQGPGYSSSLGGVDTGYVSYAYEAIFRTFSIELGGFLENRTNGVWAAVTMKI